MPLGNKGLRAIFIDEKGLGALLMGEQGLGAIHRGGKRRRRIN